MKKNAPEVRLRIEEVASILGCSINTIENWYRFKRYNPDNEYVKILPEPIRLNESPKAARYWKQSDIYKFIEFRNAIPKGRNGLMGSITQKYIKKEKKK